MISIQKVYSYNERGEKLGEIHIQNSVQVQLSDFKNKIKMLRNQENLTYKTNESQGQIQNKLHSLQSQAM